MPAAKVKEYRAYVLKKTMATCCEEIAMDRLQ